MTSAIQLSEQHALSKSKAQQLLNAWLSFSDFVSVSCTA